MTELIFEQKHRDSIVAGDFSRQCEQTCAAVECAANLISESSGNTVSGVYRLEQQESETSFQDVTDIITGEVRTSKQQRALAFFFMYYRLPLGGCHFQGHSNRNGVDFVNAHKDLLMYLHEAQGHNVIAFLILGQEPIRVILYHAPNGGGLQL